MRYGYGRVSSKGQRLYGMSLEDQMEQLKKRAGWSEVTPKN